MNEGKKIGNKNLVELSQMVKAMGHPSRITIIHLLCKQRDKRMTVKGIYNELKMSQPIISRHLSILKNSGLIIRIAEGQNTFYELNKTNETAKHIAEYFLKL